MPGPRPVLRAAAQQRPAGAGVGAFPGRASQARHWL